MNPDTIVAWPTAHFDVMGPEAGVELVHGKEIAKVADPVTRRAEILERLRAESSAYEAAAMGLIDDVIDPAETRAVIIPDACESRKSLQARIQTPHRPLNAIAPRRSQSCNTSGKCHNAEKLEMS